MSDNCEDHRTILIQNRFKLVQNLQVERSFLFDYLLSKSVFDRDDYDLVRAEKTREQKAAKVLDIIETKGEQGFDHFKDALQLINPNLYEILTGEKATFRDSPILGAADYLDSGDGLPRLIDQDILSSHLKRVTDDLRDMTLRYNSLLKEDQELRKALHICNREKTDLKNRLEILEYELSESESNASKTYTDASLTLINQYEAMQQDRHRNKDFIIQLQMKLLQCQEKHEERTRELDAYKIKYGNLEEEFLKVNENYSFQRSETKKLSATLKTRTEEAKYCDELKKQCREKLFKIMELKSELEDREKELNEIKNWTSALKQRYDSTVQERNEILTKQHETIENLSLSQNNITDMDIKVKRLTREVQELKKEREKLETETIMLKGQVSSEHRAYVKSMEKANEVKTYFSELLESKEKELSEKKEFVEYLQEEIGDLKADLLLAKDELSKVLNMNDILSRDLDKLKTDYNLTVESLEQQISEWEKTFENEKKAPPDVVEAKSEAQTSWEDENPLRANARRLSTAELLKSIRRRFKSNPSESTLLHGQGNKLKYCKSRSLDSFTPLPSRTRALPFEELSHMYSNGGETGSQTLQSTRSSQLPKFYDRERLQHLRKASSPFPLTGCDPTALFALQNCVDENWEEVAESETSEQLAEEENNSSGIINDKSTE